MLNGLRSRSVILPIVLLSGCLVACVTQPKQEVKPIEPTALSEVNKRRDAARQPLATAVVNAYSNYLGIFSSLVADFSPDGKSFLFGSNRSGRPGVYIGDVDQPTAAPKPVTGDGERANYAAFTRDGSSILLLRDQGGDEKFAIWRAKRDGTQAVNLTPNAEWIYGEPLLPRSQPNVMIYNTSRNSDTTTGVFEQNLSGGTPRLIYSQPDLGRVADVTADGKRVLFNTYRLRTLLRGTNATIRSLFVTEFGDLEQDAALLETYSPMRDISRIRAPLFVYAGANDTRVLRSESDAIVEGLRKRQIPVEYMVAPNEGHAAAMSETRIELLTRTARFLEDALK